MYHLASFGKREMASYSDAYEYIVENYPEWDEDTIENVLDKSSTFVKVATHAPNWYREEDD